ncbi:MAG TPA: DUF3379 family protein [Steroidobacteraceae bacterium]
MNCAAARELLGADPDSMPPEVRAHLESCSECEAYRGQLRGFDAKLRRALEIDPNPLRRAPAASAADEGASAQVVRIWPRAAGRHDTRPTSHPRPRWLAFAASLAGGLLVSVTLWLSRPSPALAAEVVTHVEGEPNSWSATQPISAARLDAVLRKSGVALGAGIGPIVYANSCWFRGHFVPHLVVTTPAGPVTVMILKHEHVRSASHFAEDGYSGMLSPAPEGSVAILSRAHVPLERPASSVLHALRARA